MVHEREWHSMMVLEGEEKRGGGYVLRMVWFPSTFYAFIGPPISHKVHPLASLFIPWQFRQNNSYYHPHSLLLTSLDCWSLIVDRWPLTVECRGIEIYDQHLFDSVLSRLPLEYRDPLTEEVSGEEGDVDASNSKTSEIIKYMLLMLFEMLFVMVLLFAFFVLFALFLWVCLCLRFYGTKRREDMCVHAKLISAWIVANGYIWMSLHVCKCIRIRK